MAATLVTWGRWQAALAPGRGPSVVDALVGSLGGPGAEQRVRLMTGLRPALLCACEQRLYLMTNTCDLHSQRCCACPWLGCLAVHLSWRHGLACALAQGLQGVQVLLDVGAGSGFFSLAAAARGHSAIAFELGPVSAASFEASIAHNGFQDRVKLHRLALGGADEAICVQRAPAVTNGSAAAGGPVRALAVEAEVHRGYSSPQAHNLSAGLGAAGGGACVRVAARRRGEALVPPGTPVGALRVSAAGWEGWVLEGLTALFAAAPPPVVLLELHATRVEGLGFPGGAVGLLRRLHEAGYTDVSHSGRVCDERWANITRGIRLRGSMSLAAQAALRQPTWCKLPPDKFPALVSRANAAVPENVLLVRRGAAPPPAAAAGAASSPAGSRENIALGGARAWAATGASASAVHGLGLAGAPAGGSGRGEGLPVPLGPFGMPAAGTVAATPRGLPGARPLPS